MTVCLDSWALLRWLEGSEPAASRVDETLTGQAVMSWINLGEVSDVTRRAAGQGRARMITRDAQVRLRLDLATAERTLEAAAVKADHPLAYADAFASRPPRPTACRC